MKALKITASILLSIVVYYCMLAIRITMLPYPSQPNSDWKTMIGDSDNETVWLAFQIVLSFTLQLIFLALGWIWLFWILFTITHLLVTLRKLVSFWDEITNDKNLGL